jgi:acyl-CoA synthetase (AMP-forming)/AMP-acid ligase II
MKPKLEAADAPPHDLAALVHRASSAAPDSTAFGTVDGQQLTYASLAALLVRTRDALNARGLGVSDRVVTVVPNGPLAAASFVALSSCVTTAPLNPGYRAEEFEFFLDDIAPRALVVPRGFDTPAQAVAAERGIPLVWLEPDESAPGAARSGNESALSFALCFDDAADALPAPASHTDQAGVDARSPRRKGFAGEADVALLLHTSGTTSRPKLVPLSHRNLTTSAANIARTLALGPTDVCMNIMPLFHIHGLVGAVLASLAGGAGVVCTPGFDAFRFLAWLDACRPTWYTAVPTMHHAIAARASRSGARNDEVLARHRLRFIRSSSASLPRTVLESLETTFGCPVVESYGMTEASHQMTSNPLPPAPRKVGSVGIAAGPEVAIADADGTPLPRAAVGVVGEVLVRGESITNGYLHQAEANAHAFVGGFFRTGDLGWLDEDGYLFLSGRIKELINRGGEKVSPAEVDRVLLEHPAVSQAVTFAVPHPKLGEDVAAAIVVRDGVGVSERAIKEFVSERLADFKVPRTLVFVESIPKGPTGKLQRTGLAKLLGLVT